MTPSDPTKTSGSLTTEGIDADPAGAVIDQKAFLAHAKKVLSKVHKGLTWDRMAELAEVEPRALKTYRMPENSPDHRAMPRAIRRQIEGLLDHAVGGDYAAADSGGGDDIPPERPDVFRLVAPALAALVVRVAAHIQAEGRGVVVSGIDRRHGSRMGLTADDRRTMAFVSRARLSLGLSDDVAEIHQLLWLCTLPLKNWLPLPEVLDEGLGPVRLIDPEQLMPTLEAEGLTADVSGVTSLLEEQLFGDFKEALSRLPSNQADAVYSRVREFVVRNPVVSSADLKGLFDEVPSAVHNRLRNGFYEPLPMTEGNLVRLCAHCSNLMKQHVGGWLCTTSACVEQSPAKALPPQDGRELLRLNRGLRQYWLEPGIDEVRLVDALKAAGFSPRLYPHRDRVDIDLGVGGPIGMDLKAYASPELLGRRIASKPGGLVHYAERWLVIPDWLERQQPQYMNRLRLALGKSSVQCLTTSEALKRVKTSNDGKPQAKESGDA